MSALGLAAVGYQLGNQIDYENRQRDFNRAKMDAEQVGLQDAAAATQSANRLRTAQNTEEMKLIPARAGLASTQLGIAQKDAEFKQEMQPSLQDVDRKKTDMLQQQTNHEYQGFSGKLRKDRISNAISQQDANDAALTKLVQVFDTGKSPRQTTEFYNSIIDAGALGDIPGPRAADTRLGTPDGKNGFTIVDAEGKPIFVMDEGTMGRYHALGQKLDIKDVKPGHSLVGVNTRTGAATNIFSAPPNPDGGDRKPMLVATAEWMAQNMPGMTKEAAMNRLLTSKEKGKAGFIADMMKGSIMPGMKEQDLRQRESMFGAMYDRINPGGDGSSSNSGGAPTLSRNVAPMFSD